MLRECSALWASVTCLDDSVARADHVFSVDMLASVHLSELLVSYEGRTLYAYANMWWQGLMRKCYESQTVCEILW